MKKISLSIATVTALFLSFNSFAGDGNLPKAEPKNETEITLSTPNDDPSAPPPLTNYTYFTIKKTSATTNQAEADAEPNWSYGSTLSAVHYQRSTISGVDQIQVGTYLALQNITCASAWLNSPMCTGCNTWGHYYVLGSSVTTTTLIPVPLCQ